MNKRVLFVDDEFLILSSMLRNLRGKFDIKVAQSGHEALEKLRAGPEFGVIVSDFIMPEMNGIEFFLELQHHPGNRRYIIISALAAEQQVINGLEGMVPRHLYLPKPATQVKLEERLKEVYDGPQIPQLNAPMMQVEGF